MGCCASETPQFKPTLSEKTNDALQSIADSAYNIKDEELSREKAKNMKIGQKEPHTIITKQQVVEKQQEETIVVEKKVNNNIADEVQGESGATDQILIEHEEEEESLEHYSQDQQSPREQSVQEETNISIDEGLEQALQQQEASSPHAYNQEEQEYEEYEEYQHSSIGSPRAPSNCDEQEQEQEAPKPGLDFYQASTVARQSFLATSTLKPKNAFSFGGLAENSSEDAMEKAEDDDAVSGQMIMGGDDGESVMQLQQDDEQSQVSGGMKMDDGDVSQSEMIINDDGASEMTGMMLDQELDNNDSAPSKDMLKEIAQQESSQVPGNEFASAKQKARNFNALSVANKNVVKMDFGGALAQMKDDNAFKSNNGSNEDNEMMMGDNDSEQSGVMQMGGDDDQSVDNQNIAQDDSESN